MSDGEKLVEGPRVTEVTAVQGGGEEKRWLFKVQWGENDPNPSTIHVDAQRRLHRLELGALGALKFTPPPPAEWMDLKPGEEKTVESAIRILGFEIPLKYNAKRMADQTITVPAGEFVDCQRVRVITESLNQLGQPTTTRYDYWYHPKVNGLVKEVFVYNYQTPKAYLGTSLLKSHTTP
jgi:hypothetical protein